MISISTEIILQKVLARAALRHILHADRPALLTQAHKSAVLNVMETAFNTLCASLVPHILDEQTDPGNSLLLIELQPELAETGESNMRRMLEEALTAYTLHLCYSGADHPMATAELETYNSIIKRIRDSADCPPLTVKPFWL